MTEQTWRRIVAWGESHAPAMLEDLNPGASASDIEALETAFGRRLPEDFRTSLVTHNGERDGWPCKVFADYGAYLSVDRILDIWKQRQEIARQMSQDEEEPEDPEELIREGVIFVEGPVRPELYLPEWLPIMDCNGDVFWAIDFNPAPGGKPGQVIMVDWEGTTWKVVAESFGDFLSKYATELEAGAYRVVDGQPTKEGV